MLFRQSCRQLHVSYATKQSMTVSVCPPVHRSCLQVWLHRHGRDFNCRSSLFPRASMPSPVAHTELSSSVVLGRIQSKTNTRKDEQLCQSSLLFSGGSGDSLRHNWRVRSQLKQLTKFRPTHLMEVKPWRFEIKILQSHVQLACILYHLSRIWTQSRTLMFYRNVWRSEKSKNFSPFNLERYKTFNFFKQHRLQSAWKLHTRLK